MLQSSRSNLLRLRGCERLCRHFVAATLPTSGTIQDVGDGGRRFSGVAHQSSSASNGNQQRDVNSILRDRFGDKITLVNAWKLDNIGNLEFQPRLDNATRHLIQLLQELHWNGYHQTRDTATLVRCKHLMVSLLQHHRHISKDGSSDTMEQCAYRAKAVLDAMEVFRNKESKRPISAERLNNHDLDMDKWPIPDRQVYDLVMQIFRATKVSQDLSFPRTAQAIVQNMEDLYEKTGDFHVKSIHEHWKPVLISWGRCQDWQRSVFAGTETFQLIPERIRTWKDGRDFADLLYHMIMVCTNEDMQGDRNSEKHQKARKIGADVAARIWQRHIRNLTRPGPSVADKKIQGFRDTETASKHVARMHQTEIVSDQKQQVKPPRRDRMIEFLSSYFYQNFMRAIRDLPALEIREALFDDCFALACSQGKVNRNVIKEFLLHARSNQLKNKCLQRYLKHISKMPVDNVVSELERRIPAEWSARADRL